MAIPRRRAIPSSSQLVSHFIHAHNYVLNWHHSDASSPYFYHLISMGSPRSHAHASISNTSQYWPPPLQSPARCTNTVLAHIRFRDLHPPSRLRCTTTPTSPRAAAL